MSEFEPENFEQELRKLRPAKAPASLLARLLDAVPTRPEPATVVLPARRPGLGWSWLRWLAPVGMGAAVLVFLSWKAEVRPPQPTTAPLPPTPDTALRADQVEVDQELVAVFDTIEKLPDGRPVRFRCREWSDNVTWRDSTRGVVLENRTPRLEVVPVSFETF